MNRYLESTNYMNGIMELCKWEGTTYVRTNYKFSPNLADRTSSRITDKTEYFDKIFYVVEPDGAGLNNGIFYQTSSQLINHIHLLLNLSKDEIIKNIDKFKTYIIFSLKDFASPDLNKNPVF